MNRLIYGADSTEITEVIWNKTQHKSSEMTSYYTWEKIFIMHITNKGNSKKKRTKDMYTEKSGDQMENRHIK